MSKTDELAKRIADALHPENTIENIVADLRGMISAEHQEVLRCAASLNLIDEGLAKLAGMKGVTYERVTTQLFNHRP